MSSAATLFDRLSVFRRLPEAGRLEPLDAGEARRALLRMKALRKSLPRGSGSTFFAAVERLAEALRGEIPVDAARLAVWCLVRDAIGNAEPEATLRLLLEVWNGAAPAGLRIELGGRSGAPPRRKLARVFFAESRAPRNGDDVAGVTASRVARVAGYDLGARSR